ncbi:HipA family kinase [Streptomyces sp. ZYX-F-203]
MLNHVCATRYIAPLREGGSLPGLIETDDLGTYVLKFTGAGQGRKTLVAEVVCGELARRLGLRVPRLATVDLDPVLGLGEADPEVQELLRNSGGVNLGVEYLSGALGFDPLAFSVTSEEAGRVVWFDALVGNVDRSWRNPNLLRHDGEIWLVDHGASMIWHHNWPRAGVSAARPYDASDHALLRFDPDVAGAAADLAPRVTPDLLAEVTGLIPDAWLADEPGFPTHDDVRRAYVGPLLARAATVHTRIEGAS